MRWLICILALWFVVGPTGAAAEVRSCSGDIKAADGVVVAKINGQGTCKNKAHANDCRAHAREAIEECAKALWIVRNPGTELPAACRGRRGERSAVLHWNQIILGIRANNLGDRVRWNQCCRGQKPNTKGEIRVNVAEWGDKGCGSSKVHKTLYLGGAWLGNIHFDCKTQWQNGLCGH